jgi:hypothetical protein
MYKNLLFLVECNYTSFVHAEGWGCMILQTIYLPEILL